MSLRRRELHTLLKLRVFTDRRGYPSFGVGLAIQHADRSTTCRYNSDGSYHGPRYLLDPGDFFLETSLGTANHSVEEQLTRIKALRESLVQAYLLFPVPNSGWQRHFLITNPNLHLGREAPP